MKYYEIQFYGEGDERDYSFYIKNNKELTKNEVKEILTNQYLEDVKMIAIHIGGNETTYKDVLDNIVSIDEISADEFTKCCDIIA